MLRELPRGEGARLDTRPRRYVFGVDAAAVEARPLGKGVTFAGAEPDHLEERFWAQLMLPQYRSDRQAAALGAYWQPRRHVVDDSGAEPPPESFDFEHCVLDHDPGLAVRSEP